jgi:hypothetical protein
MHRHTTFCRPWVGARAQGFLRPAKCLAQFRGASGHILNAARRTIDEISVDPLGEISAKVKRHAWRSASDEPLPGRNLEPMEGMDTRPCCVILQTVDVDDRTLSRPDDDETERKQE